MEHYVVLYSYFVIKTLVIDIHKLLKKSLITDKTTLAVFNNIVYDTMFILDLKMLRDSPHTPPFTATMIL